MRRNSSMRPTTLICLSLLVLNACASLVPRSSSDSFDAINATCRTILSTISLASGVYFPGSPQYDADVAHFANSSAQHSVCSVEPGSNEDVSDILKILGKNRTPFAVKSGGHIFNPNFSSTAGIQISLVRFNQITIRSDPPLSSETTSVGSVPPAVGTVTIGTGLIWDDVYAALDVHNLTVVGGRESGIGVGGFTLGGGFSYKTNEYGVSLANVASFDIVLPNGTVTSASEVQSPDLFWAVRGSHNNFGIVTSLTLKTYPQALVWGGYINYHLPSPSSPITRALINAAYKYSNQLTDPKATNVLSWSYSGGNASLSIHIYYDGASPAPGIFDDFLAIPNIASNISTRTYTSLVRAPNDNVTIGYRGLMDVISVQNYTYDFIEALVNETFFWGELAMQVDPKSVIDYPMEPFMFTIFDHDNGGSAWPPPTAKGQSYFPQGFEYSWTLPSADAWFLDTIQSSHKQLAAVLTKDKEIATLPRYPNYCLYTATPEDIWGDNLGKLVRLKNEFDGDNVMGLTGGWKVPLTL